VALAVNCSKITPVESKTVTVKPDGSVDPVTFTRKRDGLGRAVYRVQVPVGETESVARQCVEGGEFENLFTG